MRFSPEEGKIFLGRSRVVLVDFEALSALRRTLIESGGEDAARGTIFRAGFACGLKDAMLLKERDSIVDQEELLRAGARRLAEAGYARMGALELARGRQAAGRAGSARWTDSFEVSARGRGPAPAAGPACWHVAGYISGWATAAAGESLLGLESRCQGLGDPCCDLELRREADWGGRADGLIPAGGKPESGSRQLRSLTLLQAFNQSNDVMFYTDDNGVILAVNPAFTRHYGYEAEEAIGQTPRILRSRHSTRELYQGLWSGLIERGNWRGQIINRAKDGRELPVLLTITAVRGAGGGVLGYVSSAMDLTEQLALQGRLAQSEALAGLGEMAAVVAHEIRNPLGSIVMAGRQLASGTISPEDRAMALRVLRDESRRLSATLGNFLAYARPRDLDLAAASLNEAVSEVCRTVKANPELARGTRIDLILDQGLEPFPMDSDEMRQVVWNLVLNALQAMDGTGVLTVATGRLGGQAFLRVRDTGPGIPEEAHALVFKPFHTTKPQGTGLGLAVADRIAKAHGGRIELVSRPGEGAQFTVLIPAFKE